MQAIDALFTRPLFRVQDFAERSGIPQPTAKRMLSLLRKAGILKPVRESAGRRPAVLAFAELVNTAEGKTVL